MDPHRVQVLHVADCDAVVRGVPHDLVFELLPAEDGLLHEDLLDPGVGDAEAHDPLELLGGVGDAAPASPERVGGPDDHRVARLLDEDGRGRIVGDRAAPRDRLPDRSHEVGEALPVLPRGDRLYLRPEELDPVTAQDARLRQLAAQVERGLTAHPAQDALRPLFRDHLLDERDGERLDVDRVRGLRVRLDRGGIAVHEDDPDALLAEGPTGLGPGVVELRRLPDHDGAGTDHHRGPNVLALGHRPTPVPRPTPP